MSAQLWRFHQVGVHVQKAWLLKKYSNNTVKNDGF